MTERNTSDTIIVPAMARWPVQHEPLYQLTCVGCGENIGHGHRLTDCLTMLRSRIEHLETRPNTGAPMTTPIDGLPLRESPYFDKPTRRHLENKIDDGLLRHGVPYYMHGGIRRYLLDGIVPGDFLSAIVNNDLKAAYGCADDTNTTILLAYVRFFYNCAPALAWGRATSVHDWATAHNDARDAATRRADGPDPEPQP